MRRLEAELKKETIEKPAEEWSVDFSFRGDAKKGKRMVEAKGLAKIFGDRTLFEKSHFYVKGGEKIGFLGPNGSGKSTFIRMLLGAESITKGSVWKSPSLKIGYLPQEMNDLPADKTALEYLNAGGQTAMARTTLANMGIHASQLIHPLSAFSQGEKMKVKLVSMLLDEYDLLILDEPTNHLDLPSREALEETLLAYTGTLLIVSHDRYLVDKVCDKLLVIEDKRLKRFEFSLKEYEQRMHMKETQPGLQEDNEKAVLELKLIERIGLLGALKPGTDEYNWLNEEIDELLKRKKKQ
ncbi:ATP-binding cassette domain-containing protein [Bacillus testis]|uniref:ATP-binding cassette domain-containing protein n=1 Tax=Bacillus testis TaxID=1622072 RepID=UPI00067EEAF6|nr:ATP-binding cassette domain-containing protein [Bacillus testis]